MKEVFRTIPGYEGIYQVSNVGRVKSLSREVKHGKFNKVLGQRILKSSPDAQGYLRINLCKNGGRKTEKIHILMAIVFRGHIQSKYKGLIVDHINNIKTDNRLENIQLITHRENLSKDRKGGSSKYTGVSWNKIDKRWRSAIGLNGKDIHLGSFVNELDAASAYRIALSVINSALETLKEINEL